MVDVTPVLVDYRERGSSIPDALIAAGLDPAALSFRDAREPDWQKGLRSSTFIITDALTASQLPPWTDVLAQE